MITLFVPAGIALFVAFVFLFSLSLINIGNGRKKMAVFYAVLSALTFYVSNNLLLRYENTSRRDTCPTCHIKH